MSETSTKPYLIRALHEWCMDNGYTPYLVVTVDNHTVVPLAHVVNGQITLNVSFLATNQLVMGNDYIEFESRFNGKVEQLFVPVNAVSAIYAKETGAGMGFEVTASEPYPGTTDTSTSTDTQDATNNTDSTTATKPAGASHLKVIK